MRSISHICIVLFLWPSSLSLRSAESSKSTLKESCRNPKKEGWLWRSHFNFDGLEFDPVHHRLHEYEKKIREKICKNSNNVDFGNNICLLQIALVVEKEDKSLSIFEEMMPKKSEAFVFISGADIVEGNSGNQIILMGKYLQISVKDERGKKGTKGQEDDFEKSFCYRTVKPVKEGPRTCWIVHPKIIEADAEEASFYDYNFRANHLVKLYSDHEDPPARVQIAKEWLDLSEKTLSHEDDNHVKFVERLVNEGSGHHCNLNTDTAFFTHMFDSEQKMMFFLRSSTRKLETKYIEIFNKLSTKIKNGLKYLKMNEYVKRVMFSTSTSSATFLKMYNYDKNYGSALNLMREGLTVNSTSQTQEKNNDQLLEKYLSQISDQIKNVDLFLLSMSEKKEYSDDQICCSIEIYDIWEKTLQYVETQNNFDSKGRNKEDSNFTREKLDDLISELKKQKRKIKELSFIDPKMILLLEMLDALYQMEHEIFLDGSTKHDEAKISRIDNTLKYIDSKTAALTKGNYFFENYKNLCEEAKKTGKIAYIILNISSTYDVCYSCAPDLAQESNNSDGFIQRMKNIARREDKRNGSSSENSQKSGGPDFFILQSCRILRPNCFELPDGNRCDQCNPTINEKLNSEGDKLFFAVCDKIHLFQMHNEAYGNMYLEKKSGTGKGKNEAVESGANGVRKQN